MHGMKAAARLPSPLPSPPLLSILPHTHTVVSPRNRRHALYVAGDRAAPAALHPAPAAAVEIKKQLGLYFSPLAPTKRPPPILVMSPRHQRTHTHTSPRHKSAHLQSRRRPAFVTSAEARWKRALLPDDNSSSGGGGGGGVWGGGAHLQLQICSS